MTSFETIRKFIDKKMKMSHVYQPVMLQILLRKGGTASVTQIAESILNKDPTQLEYYCEVVKRMPGPVLTRTHKITEKHGDNYTLTGCEALTETHVAELIALCQIKIDEFESRRGDTPWSHRRRGHRPVPGSVQYQVFRRAQGRCELCGASNEEKRLEVDHIMPKACGGKDDLANYQALCYSCNAAKRNTDDTDFRQFKSLYDCRDLACLLCQYQAPDLQRILCENVLAYAVSPYFPATPGHTLFIPKRHVRDYFELAPAEVNAINALMSKQKRVLEESDPKIDGFNITVDSGATAGQTISHCHVNLIPRRGGDVSNPAGGVVVRK
jgi:ATP adenylyltransferase